MAESDREAADAGPLRGLRVVEVSSFVAAPLGGMTLRQLGADVVRVDPLGGAADRDRWPVTSDGASLYWAGLNKGKRSLVVDFRAPEGRQIVTDLLASCPPKTAVLLTNVTGRDWLAHETLSQVCPDLIHVEIRGHADGSAAVDYTVNAATGFPAVTGPQDWAGPVNHVLPAWDVACGLYAAIGVGAAALRRERTGLGERIRLALADVALAVAGHLGFLAEAEAGTSRPRIGNHLYGGFARDFTCADGGRIMVVALTARHWRDLVELTGVGPAVAALELALDVDFTREGDRYEHREVLAALVQRWFVARPTDTAADALGASSVLWSRYRTFAEVVADLRTPAGANPLMADLDQPGVGCHLAPGSPLTLGSVPRVVEPAPRLGEHTVEILARDLGWPRERIDAALGQGIVSDYDPATTGKGV